MYINASATREKFQIHVWRFTCTCSVGSNISGSSPKEDSSTILKAFWSASSNLRPMAITSPTLFIELPIFVLTYRCIRHVYIHTYIQLYSHFKIRSQKSYKLRCKVLQSHTTTLVSFQGSLPQNFRQFEHGNGPGKEAVSMGMGLARRM